MAPITLYDAAVVLYIDGIKMLLHILKKASESQDANALADARLIGDMYPLRGQVQSATDTAKKSITRLTGRDFGTWEDVRADMASIVARAEKMLAMLESVDRKEVEGVDDKTIDLPKSEGGTEPVTLQAVTLSFAVPNFFFHINMAYAILRSRGVQIGKDDYLASFNRM